MNSTYSWNTGVSLLQNVTPLMQAINANTVTADVSASLWYSNNVTGTIYLKLQYGQPGNWNGQALSCYVNSILSVAPGQQPKRALGYGTAKGNDIIGLKRYELKNHLNNVLAVISDRKWGVDDGVYNTTTGIKTSSTLDGFTDYYTSIVVAYSDYDPFGTVQDVRKGGATDYRFAFQGQEKDDEIKGAGNSYNYEYRMHDPRIGRFFAVDPLAPKYPYYTPYAFSGNRLIDAIELEGREPQSISPQAAFNYFENLFEAAPEGLAQAAVDASYILKDNVHEALDVIGCIPIVGEVADGVNGLIYNFEGDHVNALISYAAIIPVVGDAGKLSRYAVKYAKTADAIVTGGRIFKTARKAQSYLETVAKYGDRVTDALWDRAKLRTALKETAETTIKGEWRAHHLIPVEALKENSLVKQAVNEGYDFNGMVNGMAVDYWRHKGSHAAWNEMVTNVINAAQASGKYDSAKETMEAVAKILEFRIKTNQGLTIQQIGKKYTETQ